MRKWNLLERRPISGALLLLWGKLIWATIGWTSCETLSVVFSRVCKSWLLWLRTAGEFDAKLWDIAWIIIERFWSISCRKLSFIRKLENFWRALVWTFTLLSCISLHSTSTSYMNLEGCVCFTVIECFSIQSWTSSMAWSLLLQSAMLHEAIKFLKSSISWGSTGLDTDCCLFLKFWIEVSVTPKPFEAPWLE